MTPTGCSIEIWPAYKIYTHILTNAIFTLGPGINNFLPLLKRNHFGL